MAFCGSLLACSSLIEKWHITVSESADLLAQAGKYLREHGDHLQAEPLFQRAQKIKQMREK
jgi:hypothetical protein